MEPGGAHILVGVMPDLYGLSSTLSGYIGFASHGGVAWNWTAGQHRM